MAANVCRRSASRIRVSAVRVASLLLVCAGCTLGADGTPAKPAPDEVLAMLRGGNERFVGGRSVHPHSDADRLRLAGSASQADYAYATVLTCSDSRVPVEHIFDAGVMDLFVIRVAGNVCNTDEIGSIEYGLAHVRTPVLLILGHSQCGAVTAVTEHLRGKGHTLERNIPPLVKSIEPAVQRAMIENPALAGSDLVAKGIEENVWTGIENVFLASPAVRQLVATGKVKVAAAIYNVGDGRVAWLSESTIHRLLGRAEASPDCARDAMDKSHGGSPAAEHSGADGKAGEQVAAAHGSGDGRKKAGAAREPAKSHDGAAPTTAKEHGDAHGAEASASAGAAGARRPWGLLAACGVLFVVGLSVALIAHFSRGRSASHAAPPPAPKPAAPAPQSAAPAR